MPAARPSRRWRRRTCSGGCLPSWARLSEPRNRRYIAQGTYGGPRPSAARGNGPVGGVKAGKPQARGRSAARFRRDLGRRRSFQRHAVYPPRPRSRFPRRHLCRHAREHAGSVGLSADARPRQGARSRRRHPYAGEDRPLSRIHPPSAAAEARGLGCRRPRAVLAASARCIRAASCAARWRAASVPASPRSACIRFRCSRATFRAT